LAAKELSEDVTNIGAELSPVALIVTVPASTLKTDNSENKKAIWVIFCVFILLVLSFFALSGLRG
jgi:hypothetical protein